MHDTSLNLAAAADGSGSGVGSTSWLGWMWGWVSSWFYGPNITLHDCLAYFFSADELKGENMYSCEKCKRIMYIFTAFRRSRQLDRNHPFSGIKSVYSTAVTTVQQGSEVKS